jgi:cephalosporin hydroxylase
MPVVDGLDLYIDVEASLAAMSNQGVLLADVPAMKGLEDLRRYAAIIRRTGPDLIIQTGTAVGGSALWFATGGFALRFANGGPDVVTIDTDPSPIHPTVRASEKVTILTGSSTDEDIVASVQAIAAGYANVMVVLDSDHSSSHVRREIEVYGPLVSPGCYLVVEDGIYDLAPDGPFKPGPLDAISACLAGSPDWNRDPDIESLEDVSMYPGGWWVKK